MIAFSFSLSELERISKRFDFSVIVERIYSVTQAVFRARHKRLVLVCVCDFAAHERTAARGTIAIVVEDD
jgi:hypothetical protein